ncbi:MAG: TspO/MBR family protein [Pseudomonadota bacterium]
MDSGDNKLLVIGVAAGIAIVVAVLGAVLTDVGEWYVSLDKPAWQPPDWAFGPAWTLIFAATATAGVLAWNTGQNRSLVLGAFGVNAILNVAWSALFFRLRRPDWALFEVLLLWLSVTVLIAVCGRLDSRAGWLLLLYLAWVSFAAVLNAAVVRRNRPFA